MNPKDEKTTRTRRHYSAEEKVRLLKFHLRTNNQYLNVEKAMHRVGLKPRAPFHSKDLAWNSFNDSFHRERIAPSAWSRLPIPTAMGAREDGLLFCLSGAQVESAG